MNVLTTDNQGLMRKHRFPREPAPTFCRFEPPSGHATRWRDRVAPPSPGWFGPSYQADLQLPEGPARTSVPCRQPGRGDAARHGRCFASGKVLQSCPSKFSWRSLSRPRPDSQEAGLHAFQFLLPSDRFCRICATNCLCASWRAYLPNRRTVRRARAGMPISCSRAAFRYKAS